MQNNKIAVIAPANVKYVPYIQYFLATLDELSCEYSVISWNKAGIKENVDFSFDYRVSDFKRFKMMIGYLKFRRFCNRIIKKENFDKIIFLTIAPLFFCGMGISKKYKNKYILDIRDATPLVTFFPKRVDRMIKNAYEVTSSSFMFRRWIGRDLVLSHNANVLEILKHFDDSVIKKTSKKKTIVFAGMMIEEKVNIEIIKQYANHLLLEFVFVGRETPGKTKIEAFVKDNGINNVRFEGAYDKDDIVTIYKEKADFVNIFREKTEINKNAIPNKLYDAVISGVPLLVFDHNEGIASFTKEYNLGIVLEAQDISNIYELMCSFDYDKFEVGRKKFLKQVLCDHNSFKKSISSFLKVN